MADAGEAGDICADVAGLHRKPGTAEGKPVVAQAAPLWYAAQAAACHKDARSGVMTVARNPVRPDRSLHKLRNEACTGFVSISAKKSPMRPAFLMTRWH